MSALPALEPGARNPSALKQRRYANQPERIGRPLRVAPKPEPWSSLPGIVALATEENVLPHLDIVLAQARIYLDRNAYVTHVDDERLDLLATVLGVDAQILRAASTPYLPTLEKDDGGVAWGRGTLKRVDIETRVRRISPTTLAGDPTHRKEWLNLLLPFCPTSLELLTSRCSNPACGKALGWNRSIGVGICEHCEQAVQPTARTLAPELADDYRIFARIVSPDASAAEAAVGQLPDRLRALSQSELIMLILKLGNASALPGRTVNRTFYGDLAADEMALVVAKGTALLRTWPSSVIERGKRLLEEDDGTGKRFVSFRKTIRGMSPLGTVGHRPFQMFIRESLPEMFSYMSKDALADWLPRAEAESLAKIKIVQLTILRDSRAIGLRKVGRREKGYLYSRVDLEAFRHAFVNSSTSTALATRWGLPFYAIEQMLLAGMLDPTRNTALATLYPWRRVDLTKAERLERDLRERRSSTPPPAGMSSVREASLAIGGGFKPWPAIIGLLLAQDVRYWIRDDAAFGRRGAGLIDTLLTDQHGVAAIMELAATGNATLDRLSVGDSAEVLNSFWQKVAALPDATFERAKVLSAGAEQRLIPAADLLEMARTTVTAKEIAARTSTKHWAATNRLRKLQLPETPLGFCRISTERALGLSARVD